MPRNFYYRKESQIVSGSANFASLISANPTTYGLVAAQATAYQALDSALQSAYQTAITPETRTPVAIQAKNVAVNNMRRLAVNLASVIYSTATVNDSQLVALGLLPRSTYTPRPAPTTPPMVEVLSVRGRIVKVRIHAESSEGARKPVGTVGANVYTFVGPEAPTDPRQYHYEGMATRGTCEILFPNEVASGATAWIAAAWMTQRGESGVACTPISVTIQGGPILAGAA